MYPDAVVMARHLRQKTALAVVIGSEMAQISIREGRVVEARLDLWYIQNEADL